MAIFTDGESTAINSPRHLTLRHALRAVKLKKQELGELSKDEKVLPDLKPGEEKLNSFWAPALEAGPTHHITVRQIVDPKDGGKPLQLDSQQDFLVDAPQFSLPTGSVHSVYPSPGYSEDHRILPHVVLTDPHLPWERLGSPKTGEHHTDRNRVPWLALFVFTQDELRLPATDMEGDKSIFSKTSGRLPKPVKQTSTLAVHMTLNDLLSTNDNVISPQIKPSEDIAGDFIFIKPDLFTSLFSPFDESNKRVSVPSPDVSQYKFLSHVRKINTTGMAVAGVEEIGIFSIVIANRSGPLDNLKSTTASVHLVSIEGVENMSFPIDKRYVALCSLHSWNYTVMPPNMLNVPDTFEFLGANLGLLRPPDDLIKDVRSSAAAENKDTSSRLANRLEDGYSLVRYRTQTGETTVALFRGPFTPTVVPRRWAVPEDSYSDAAAEYELGRCSNSGLELQVLDKEVGIMDITYSTAWQVGRMLALADQVFTTALMRLRANIHRNAMKKSRISVVTKESDSSFLTREHVLGDLPMMRENLGEIPLADGKPTSGFAPGGPLKRWHRFRLRAGEFPHLGFGSAKIQRVYYDAAIKAAEDLAQATNGHIYDERNDPVSTDWMIVLAWVMNKMFLHGVPAHYLITDPSHLDHERLQFFYIDPNWTDAMIDGALSLGNHLGDDIDRVAIKKILNRYINEKPPLLDHPPQIPRYGFYLRSDLVSMFPDLKVTTLPEPKTYPPERAPLLRHEIITDGVMLGLFDRTPGSDEFKGLVFTQPPHQQRFAAARGLETDHITIQIRRQYTVDQADRETDKNWQKPLDVSDLPSKPSDPNNMFVWGSKPGLNDLHILRLPHYADVQLNALVTNMGSFKKGDIDTKYFDDDTATSALMALQLNDPIYSLTINLASAEAKAVLARLDSPGSTPGTLALLKPSVVNRATTEFNLHSENEVESGAGSDAESDEQDYSTLTEGVMFGRDSGYSPAPHALYNSRLAPHVTPIHSETARPSTRHLVAQPSLAMPASLVSDPAGSPNYTCQIHSVGHENILIDKDNLPQDLIFSVLVSNNYNPAYKITEFHIWVELGKVDDKNHMLMANYEGPGPSMLSNLRFNVLPKFAKDLNDMPSLELVLLPRSTKQYVDITLVNEMSFILALVQVNNFQEFTQLWVYTEVQYENHKSEKDRFEVTIVKKKE